MPVKTQKSQYSYSSTHGISLALDGGEWQRHTLATLPPSPGRSPVTLFRGTCVGCGGGLDGYGAEKVLFHLGSNLKPSSS